MEQTASSADHDEDKKESNADHNGSVQQTFRRPTRSGCDHGGPRRKTRHDDRHSRRPMRGEERERRRKSSSVLPPDDVADKKKVPFNTALPLSDGSSSSSRRAENQASFLSRQPKRKAAKYNANVSKTYPSKKYFTENRVSCHQISLREQRNEPFAALVPDTTIAFTAQANDMPTKEKALKKEMKKCTVSAASTSSKRRKKEQNNKRHNHATVSNIATETAVLEDRAIKREKKRRTNKSTLESSRPSEVSVPPLASEQETAGVKKREDRRKRHMRVMSAVAAQTTARGRGAKRRQEKRRDKMRTTASNRPGAVSVPFDPEQEEDSSQGTTEAPSGAAAGFGSNDKRQRDFQLVVRVDGPHLPPSENEDMEQQSSERTMDADVVPVNQEEAAEEKHLHVFCLRGRTLLCLVLFVVVVVAIATTVTVVTVSEKKEGDTPLPIFPPPTRAPTMMPSASLAPSFSTVPVTLVIRFDKHASETGWTLECNGIRYKSVGIETYAQQREGDVVYETTNVPEGAECELTLLDSYGDGICCENGRGFYQIYLAEKADVPDGFVAAGGEFGGSETVTFVADPSK